MNPEDPLEDLKLRAKMGTEKLKQAAVLIREAQFVCKPVNYSIENGSGLILNTRECDALLRAEEDLINLLEGFE